MRASRLLSILILLQLRQRLTAEQLAAEFEVSPRTIHRDIEALSAAGVPVYGERGPGGGFQLHAGWRTQLTGLDADEARALPLLTLPAAARELGLGDAARRAGAKLLAALPGDSATLSGRLQACFHVDPLGWYHAPDAVPHLPALAQAVLDGRRVLIDYQSWKGPRRYQAEPLGLVLKAGQWYAVVAAGARTMTLKVTQVQALTVLDEVVERRPDFDLARWWQASVERFERELRPLRATLRASPEGCRRLAELGDYAAQAVARATPAPSPAGWRRLSLPIETAEQAVRLVMGLAPEVELIDPASLRAQLARWCRALARQHQSPP
ncbi:WYL domain-containing protein [Ideonella sp. 4Y16]|uniref:WYL domain-containing protein n=1 Tax=Ideonella alba TaxID=2824118 RepID=A0A940Y8B5_9BURK|nr:WYL domain-containing protein [Ideonella alba]MBQ0930516.1 WYL domain-containing protein [Ideonella alba]MBQ0945232.1 WYL domain-containing protein [Ideonella alba]